jgi:hypothetical protein
MRKVPASVQARVAACAAVGLSYWSGHPVAGCVWAVDSDQAAHVVKIDYKGSRARVVKPAQVWGARAFDAAGPWAAYAAEDWQAALAPAGPAEVAA